MAQSRTMPRPVAPHAPLPVPLTDWVRGRLVNSHARQARAGSQPGAALQRRHLLPPQRRRLLPFSALARCLAAMHSQAWSRSFADTPSSGTFVVHAAIRVKTVLKGLWGGGQ
jgi:hypothetical protein